MADIAPGTDFNHPILNLSPDERRYFKQLFNDADTDNLGVVTGEVAVKFFERTKVPSPVLGIIWQIADTENRGLLTSSGFCIVLRLIGHYQAGRDPTQELAFKAAPLPKFEGLSPPPSGIPPQIPAANIQPQISGGPIRVPPLSPDKATEYASLFDKFGANGFLPGDIAKQIFEKAGLSNEVLSRIWNLADTEQRGALSVVEFIIAMHLLASMKSGAMKGIPNNLPAGLYDAATRRAAVPARAPVGPLGPSAIPRQFSGQNTQRTQSPISRPPFGTPPQSAQATGNDWAITPQEKASYDSQFSKIDKEGLGYINGEQAVTFFTDSGLPEEILAAIWDLADINSIGQLSRDEFAVAMYLIRAQRKPGTNLPTVLPANLIPPSMRNQVRPPAKTTAPVFDTGYSAHTAPKSAADDLFGLDSFSAPAPAPEQTQQSTGGSGTFNRPFDTDPFGSKTSSPTSPQFGNRSQRSDFKPFMPTSSFGQALTTRPNPQQTSSPLSQSRELPQPSSTMDDLLGDNDPEVSKKLTQETSELANMSNQIGTLRTQMQEVQNKKGSTEKELAGASTQKRDLELRLSQFRSQYEQEAKNVKLLEERLTASRNETRKLQSDLALIEGSYQDLQNDFRQKSAAYEADQQENASLKERIRQLNNEIANIKPQLEKLKADSRQQRGLVAINKKQVSTSEQERDRMRNEVADLSKPIEPSRSPYPPPTDSDVVSPSPAASTVSQSTNPFFRKSPAPAENTMSPSGFSRSESLANTRDFDNIFGPSASASTSTAPQTSFRSDNKAGSSVRSSEPDVPTPSTSPPLSSYHESPRTVDPPPPPPESRQFGSNLLPLRENVPRSDSFSSSVKVSAPASRYDDGTGAETPTASNASAAGRSRPETSRGESSSYGAALFDRNRTASPAVSATSESMRDAKDNYQTFGAPSTSRDIPGAFPGDSNSPLQPDITGNSTQSKNTDPFAAKPQARGPGSTKLDFDSAFADYQPGRQVQEKQHTGSSQNDSTTEAVSHNKFNKEFPPIEEFRHDDDDSDSNSEHGFADNFTPASPQAKQDIPSRPTTSTTNNETSADDFFGEHGASQAKEDVDLPTPNAQQSPPTYEQTVPARSGSNQFPPEFSGLLPARTDPTMGSPNSVPADKAYGSAATGGSQGHTLFGGPSSGKPSAANTTFSASPPPNDTPTSTVPSDAYHSAVSHPNSGSEPGPTQSAPKTTFNDDFDSGFDDLSEAKEADDKVDDEFVLSSQHRDDLDEFNPVFDSPAASKANTMASQQTPTGKPNFGDDNDFDQMSQSFNQGKPPSAMNVSHDWDAIFSGIDSSTDKVGQAGASELNQPSFPSFDGPSSDAPKASQPPQLGRALSANSEHDDPIVQQFTSMGFPRSKVVPALEKFDYDSQKAGEFLASEGK